MFGVVDIWALPNKTDLAWTIRAISAGGFLAVLPLIRMALFKQHYTVIIVAVFSNMLIAVLWLIGLAGPDEFGGELYFVALIFIIMGLFTWVHLSARWVLAQAFIIIGSYGVVIAAFRSELIDQNLPVFGANVLFLIGASTIGFMSYRLRVSYMLENVQLRRR